MLNELITYHATLQHRESDQVVIWGAHVDVPRGDTPPPLARENLERHRRDMAWHRDVVRYLTTMKQQQSCDT